MPSVQVREISITSARPVSWPAGVEASPKDGKYAYAIGIACLIFVAIHLVFVSTAVLIFAAN
jgi:hypothetical protein